jgi:hypothetical protein
MAGGSANEPVDHVSTRAGAGQLRDFTETPDKRP